MQPGNEIQAEGETLLAKEKTMPDMKVKSKKEKQDKFIVNLLIGVLIFVMVFFIFLLALDLSGVLPVAKFISVSTPGSKQQWRFLQKKKKKRLIHGALYNQSKLEVQMKDAFLSEDDIQNDYQDLLSYPKEQTKNNLLADDQPDFTTLVQNQLESVKRLAKKLPSSSIMMAETETQAVTDIEHPLIDQKKYRYFTLENDLKVLLIHDQQAQISSAALSVKAGSWNEPKEWPGLAHFLEHMLFQGSEKFPTPGYFDAEVSKAGGQSNAYTENTETTFYMTVGSNHIEHVLQIFAHFFVDPLLDARSVNNEVNAVNSEYEIDASDDNWKLQNLITLLSDPKHPLSRFTIGNTETLQREGVVEALKEFHQKHYSSDIMTLAIRTNKDLLYMEKFLKEQSDFAQIPNNNLADHDQFKDIGYPIKTHLSSVIKFNTNSDTKQIVLAYQVPGQRKYRDTKPLDFISTFINRDGKGSLKHYISELEYGVDIETGSFIEEDNFQFYLVEVLLNENAKFDQRQTAFRLAKLFTNYFQLLEEQFFDEDGSITSYLQEQYEDQAKLSQLQFKYMDDGADSQLSDIAFIASSLHHNPIEEVLSGDFVLKHLNSKAIKETLSYLTSSDNILIFIGDKSYQYLEQEDKNLDASILVETSKGSAPEDMKFIRNEKLEEHNTLYHLDYSIQKMTLQTRLYINRLDESIVDKLSFPEQNPYIPHPHRLQLVSECTKVNDQFVLDVSNKENLLMIEESNPPLEQQNSQQLIFKTNQKCQKEESKRDATQIEPKLIENQSTGTVWWKSSRQWQVPSIYAAAKIESPEISPKDPKDQALLKVFQYYVQDKLSEELDQATQAGYSFSFTGQKQGFTMRLYGWSEKFEDCWKDAITSMRDEQINEKRFDKAVSLVQTELKSVYQKRLYEQAAQTYLPMIMLHPHVTPNELLSTLQDLNSRNLADFRKTLLNDFQYKILFSGNLLEQNAIKIAEDIQKFTKLEQMNINKYQVTDLKGKSIVYATQSNGDANDVNGVTFNYYQIGKRTQKQLALMQILQNSLQNHAYEYLRTQRQLGYIVAAQFKPIGCVDGVAILVQGSQKTPQEVNEEVEHFLKKYGDKLKNMPHGYLNQLKKGSISQLKQKETSLEDQSEYLWSHISTDDLSFEEREKSIEMIKSLTKKDVITFYEQIFHSDHVGKLSVQIYGKGMLKDKFDVNSTDQFESSIKPLQYDQNYQHRQEILVFSPKQLSKHIHTVHECDCVINGI